MANIVNAEFIEKYSKLCPENVAISKGIDVNDLRQRAIYAYNILHPYNPIKLITYQDVIDWWRKQNFETIDDFMNVLENYQVVFTVNSNAIEDINVSYHTTREIYEEGDVSNFSGSFTDLLSVWNQKAAFNKIFQALINKQPITVDFICDLHKCLLHGCYDQKRWNKGERPGTFKKHDYVVGLTDEGSLPNDVLNDLLDLLDEITSFNSVDNVKYYTSAAYFHCKFEQIHPFADGNGRLGRLLLNYYLMLNNLPPIVIPNEDKSTYYLALEVFDRTGELDGFIKFLKEQTVSTWQNVV